MGEIRIRIMEGILAEFEADVIVNSTSRSLLVSTGTLSKSLCLDAGPALQQECSRKYPDGVSLGDVAVTLGYNLPCKYIYHGALPSWDSEEVGDKLDILCLFVCNCLFLAHENGLKSLAFPTLGCGFLGYPADDVASTMYQCVATFCSGMPGTCIRDVTIVIFNKGADWRHTRRAFRRELHGKRRELVPEAIGESVDGRKAPAAGIDRLKIAVDVGERDGPSKARKGPGTAINRPKTPIPARPSLVREDTCFRESKGNGCKRTLVCGHKCGGYRREETCPPCLQKGCQGNSKLNQTSEDDCAICYTDILAAAPVCVLKCRHVFHLHCANRMLTNRWVGPRITFNFMLCPICKTPIDHPKLRRQLVPLMKLQEDIHKKAKQRADFENLSSCEEVKNPSSPFYRKLDDLALHRYCYYLCFKCRKPYYGGLAQCEDEADGEFKPSELICGACSTGSNQKECRLHGTDFQEYKCRYCCSVAVFFCLGHSHFCQPCHDGFLFPKKERIPKCPAGPCGVQLKGKCPLGIKHAPTGAEFSLGCGLCNNINSF